jgi:hypothetical protein
MGACLQVTVSAYTEGHAVLVGPSSTAPHLELTVRPYSSIPAQLALLPDGSPNPGIGVWDTTIACVAMSAVIGTCRCGPCGHGVDGWRQPRWIGCVNGNELRVGFSNTTRNPEGILLLSHSNRKS